MIKYSLFGSKKTPHSCHLANLTLIVIRLICFSITMISLFLGFSLNRYPISFYPLLVIGIIWVVGGYLHIEWISTFVFLLSILWTAVGFAYNFTFRWLLLALFSALTTWDLDHLSIQVNMAMRVVKPGYLFVKHLQSLFFTICIGMILTIIPMITPLKLNFGLTVLLSLGMFLGLRELFRFPKQILKKQ